MSLGSWATPGVLPGNLRLVRGDGGLKFTTSGLGIVKSYTVFEGRLQTSVLGARAQVC